MIDNKLYTKIKRESKIHSLRGVVLAYMLEGIEITDDQVREIRDSKDYESYQGLQPSYVQS